MIFSKVEAVGGLHICTLGKGYKICTWENPISLFGAVQVCTTKTGDPSSSRPVLGNLTLEEGYTAVAIAADPIPQASTGPYSPCYIPSMPSSCPPLLAQQETYQLCCM